MADSTLDYTIRALSEDAEVLNEETVIDAHNGAENDAFRTMEAAMRDVYARTPDNGPIEVQLIDSDDDRVLYAVRIDG